MAFILLQLVVTRERPISLFTITEDIWWYSQCAFTDRVPLPTNDVAEVVVRQHFWRIAVALTVVIAAYASLEPSIRFIGVICGSKSSNYSGVQGLYASSIPVAPILTADNFCVWLELQTKTLDPFSSGTGWKLVGVLGLLSLR
jgi:hypothetical protein